MELGYYTDEQLQQMYGTFPKKWTELEDARRTEKKQKDTLTPEKFELWLQWYEAAQRKLENASPGPSGN